MKTTTLSAILSLSVAALVGCVDRVEVDDRPCPCADDYECVDNRCVAQGDVRDMSSQSPQSDGGVPSSEWADGWNPYLSPVDGRDPSPPPAGLTWSITNAGLGDRGWRDSTELFTPPGAHGMLRANIWSRPGQVVVLSADGLGVGSPVVQQNNGQGWTSHSLVSPPEAPSLAMGYHQLYGTPDGELLVATQLGILGPLRTADLSTATEPATWEALRGVSDVAVVDAELAYAAAGTKLLRFDGSGWATVPVALPHAIDLLWADRQVVFGVGATGTIVSLEANGAQWHIHDSGTAKDFRSIWGFSQSNVWAATEDDLYHYDGSSWRKVAWRTAQVVDDTAGSYIQGLWGHDGTLFIHTRTHVLRHGAGETEVVGSWPCTDRKLTESEIETMLPRLTPLPDEPGYEAELERQRRVLAETTVCAGGLEIVDLWGNAADEVFLLVADGSRGWPSVPEHLVNRLAVLRFDGSVFHQM